ncbi:MAG: redoxin domain-containing protein [Pirellulaceae bacterium]
MRQVPRYSLCSLTFAAFILGLVVCQTASAQATPVLPSEPHAWLNTAPYRLEGKGVVFWYFEEGCPRCRAKWPELIELSAKYADQPVIFVAVSSGTARTELNDYVRDIKLKWPVLVDSQRSFEKQSGVGEISLQNIFQIAYIDGSGKFRQGRWDDLESTVKAALSGARWSTSPSQIPSALLPAWRSIEFGQFAGAAETLLHSQALADSHISSAAKRLIESVEHSITADINQLPPTSDRWERYVQMRNIANRYRGFVLPADFRSEGNRLHADPEIKRRIQSLNSYD